MTELSKTTGSAVKTSSKIEAIEGVLSVVKVYPNGTSEKIFEEKNLIVFSAKLRMLQLVYSNMPITADPITSLGIGTGGSIDPLGLYPKTPSSSMTALYHPVLRIPVSYTLNNDVPSITFIADLDQGTGNGQLITEAGLYTVSDTLFNIKTFPGIPKTSEFSLHFEWTIKIA